MTNKNININKTKVFSELTLTPASKQEGKLMLGFVQKCTTTTSESERKCKEIVFDRFCATHAHYKGERHATSEQDGS